MKNGLARGDRSLPCVIQGCFWGAAARVPWRMAACSLSGVQKGVTFLFLAEGGHSLSHVPQMLVLHISEGEGAMPFMSHAGAGELEASSTPMRQCPARLLQNGEISIAPHLPELSITL